MSLDPVAKSSRVWIALWQYLWSEVASAGSPVSAVEQLLLGSMAQGFLTCGCCPEWAPGLELVGEFTLTASSSVPLWCGPGSYCPQAPEQTNLGNTWWSRCVTLSPGVVTEGDISQKWQFLSNENVKWTETFEWGWLCQWTRASGSQGLLSCSRWEKWSRALEGNRR